VLDVVHPPGDPAWQPAVYSHVCVVLASPVPEKNGPYSAVHLPCEEREDGPL
jgi:hypothetical protein